MSSPLNYVHQQGLFDPALARPVTLIGAGAVGSMVAFLIRKAAPAPLTVYDADSVSSHNAPISLYGPGDVGRFKVHALHDILVLLTGTGITAHQKMYEGEKLKNTSVIASVDTMVARKCIWEQAKGNPTVDIFLDTRTHEWYIEVFAVNPHDPEDVTQYEKSLHGDEGSARRSCGRHGVMSASVRAADVAVLNLQRFWLFGKKKFRHGERSITFDIAF